MEVVLPLRAIRQPHPVVHPSRSGDCLACCISGITGLSLQEVYASLLTVSTTRFDLIQALHDGLQQGLFDRIITESPLWVSSSQGNTFGLPSWVQMQAWWSYIAMAMDAGYYGITLVDAHQRGPLTDTNHAVLIVGVRERKEGARVMLDVLVSCPAEMVDASIQGEWVEAEQFLQRRGGFPVLLARPARKGVLLDEITDNGNSSDAT